jgi:small subunit ribosomal protein S18
MARPRRRPALERRRTEPDVPRRGHVDYVDYKDLGLLEGCGSDRPRIRGRRVTGHDSRQQREYERAVKTAHEMALLPYGVRLTRESRSWRQVEDLRGHAEETA